MSTESNPRTGIAHPTVIPANFEERTNSDTSDDSPDITSTLERDPTAPRHR